MATPPNPDENAEKYGREYFLDNEKDKKALLNNLEISKPVPNGFGGYALLPGEPITESLIHQLEVLFAKKFITSIMARPRARAQLMKAAQKMEKVFDVIGEILDSGPKDIDAASCALQTNPEFKELKKAVENQIRDVYHLFNDSAITYLRDLNNHHPNTANHSIITGFNEMELCHEMGLNEDRLVQRVMAVVTHDLGKTKVKPETLNWPGRLNPSQWEEMQFHPLMGFKLLYQSKKLDIAAITALLHHEWYATVPGKGYGGLTLFRDHLLNDMKIDLPKAMEDLGPEAWDLPQECAIADMVSALEEIRAYKKRIGPFKVLVIMMQDAAAGHFNPKHIRIWYKAYRRKNPYLLPKGLCVGLPREIERKYFGKARIKRFSTPRSILTPKELAQMKIPGSLFNPFQIEDMRRQGGIHPDTLRALIKQKHIDFSLDGALTRLGISPLKWQVSIQPQFIELDIKVEWLSYNDLVRLDMINRLKGRAFDPVALRDEDGISLDRIKRRGGIHIRPHMLREYDISPIKKRTIRLPAYEERVDAGMLERFGMIPILEKADLAIKKYGIPSEELVSRHIPLSRIALKQLGLPEDSQLNFTDQILQKLEISREYKIFYDMHVVEEVDGVGKAKVFFLREGDHYDEIIYRKPKKLDSLQLLLRDKIGIIEIDFSHLLDMPDLSHIKPGKHWPPYPKVLESIEDINV
ncbi:MAG: hypothetical protein HQL54_10140 [Magnetococcales bacterium]|nr:hypothetical protein [Magnetococcales bacterium]